MSPLQKIFAAIQSSVRTLSPTCRDATRLQSLAMDRNLTRSQRFGLRVHLILCRWCRRYRQQLELMRGALRSTPDKLQDSPPPRLSEAARERMRESLRNDQS